ncbi:MAG: hypothetical protein NVSMB60_06040 [Mycobacterium sp.]
MAGAVPMTTRLGWLRSPRFVLPVLAALLTAIAVGVSVLWLKDRAAEEVHLQGDPLTDAQAAGQVVASAKQIVSIAQLHGATGGYAFMSCRNKNEPPYQVAFYMTFPLPQDNSVKYLRDVAAAMAARGWMAAPATAEHFGEKLTKDGVTAIFYGSNNDTGLATLRLYGECRDTADHRNDDPVWTEVTDQLG